MLGRAPPIKKYQLAGAFLLVDFIEARTRGPQTAWADPPTGGEVKQFGERDTGSREARATKQKPEAEQRVSWPDESAEVHQ